jgi:hypothetical protein
MTEKKKPAVPLKANVLTVKSTKLPAVKAKREYFQFDAYTEAARVLRMRIDVIMASVALEKTADVSYCDDLQSRYAAFAAGRELFERDEFYRMRKTARQDMSGTWTNHEITRRVVIEKIGLLIGSFPNAAPHNAETYIGLLIEEIIAANPSVTVLEATCRELRRSKTFVPTISEVLKELHAQAEKWSDCLHIYEDDIEYWQQERARLIAAADAKAAKDDEARKNLEH